MQKPRKQDKRWNPRRFLAYIPAGAELRLPYALPGDGATYITTEPQDFQYLQVRNRFDAAKAFAESRDIYATKNGYVIEVLTWPGLYRRTRFLVKRSQTGQLRIETVLDFTKSKGLRTQPQNNMVQMVE